MTDAEILELGKKRAEEIGLKPQLEINFSSSHGLMMGPKTFVEGKIYAYHADDIHRLLGNGVEMFTDHKCIAPNQIMTSMCTHKSLLVAIRPFKPETREQKLEGILRELMQALLDNNLNERLRVLNRAEELLR